MDRRKRSDARPSTSCRSVPRKRNTAVLDLYQPFAVGRERVWPADAERIPNVNVLARGALPRALAGWVRDRAIGFNLGVFLAVNAGSPARPGADDAAARCLRTAAGCRARFVSPLSLSSGRTRSGGSLAARDRLVLLADGSTGA